MNINKLYKHRVLQGLIPHLNKVVTPVKYVIATHKITNIYDVYFQVEYINSRGYKQFMSIPPKSNWQPYKSIIEYVERNNLI